MRDKLVQLQNVSICPRCALYNSTFRPQILIIVFSQEICLFRVRVYRALNRVCIENLILENLLYNDNMM